MFTHTSTTLSLHSMATRLSQIRPSGSTEKDLFNRTSSPTKVRSRKMSMYQASQQRDHMAHPPTKSQQAGPRRPYYLAYIQNDAVRDTPGCARPVPETPRKPHRQDWERKPDVMKSLPRQPKSRQALQEIDRNVESLSCSRDKRFKASMESDRTADLFTMINDHLAWNMSTSDLSQHSSAPSRPSSSGTMFVDFGADGEVEISYRNGPNKKLPNPPVPSKILAQSTPTSSRKMLADRPKIAKFTKQYAEKPSTLWSTPSHSLRHDSVFSRTASHTIDISQPPPLPPPSRPLPPLPPQARLHPQSRKSYPPQVHTTSRSVSTTKTHSSPAVPLAARHTARVSAHGNGDGMYTVIEPEGMTVYKSSGLMTSTRVTVAAYSHPEACPTPQMNSFLPVPTSTSPHAPTVNSSTRSSSTHVPLAKMDTNKPLPPLPAQSQDPGSHGTRSRQRVVPKENKRDKVARFVKTVLRKMGGLAGELHQHRHECR